MTPTKSEVAAAELLLSLSGGKKKCEEEAGVTLHAVDIRSSSANQTAAVTPSPSHHAPTFALQNRSKEVHLIKEPQNNVNQTNLDTTKTEKKVSTVPSDSAGLDSLSFEDKLRCILSEEGYSQCITWLPNGKAFRILSGVMMEEQVLPFYFKKTRYASFLRRLKKHGFKQIMKGTKKETLFYHEGFVRDIEPVVPKILQDSNASIVSDDPSPSTKVDHSRSKNILEVDGTTANMDGTKKKPAVLMQENIQNAATPSSGFAHLFNSNPGLFLQNAGLASSLAAAGAQINASQLSAAALFGLHGSPTPAAASPLAFSYPQPTATHLHHNNARLTPELLAVLASNPALLGVVSQLLG